MKKWLSGCCLLLCMTAAAQKKDFTLPKLLQFAQLPPAELSQRLAKQDFFAAGTNDSTIIFQKALKKPGVSKSLSVNYTAGATKLLFNTCSAEEFGELKAALEASFYFAGEKNAPSGGHTLYQKGSFCVAPSIANTGAQTIYSLAIEHRLLPQPQDIRFVEDLLQLPSHEYLAATFGESQVQKDQFYFSESETNKCSVLFPHTARQVIIVWKDEANNREPALVVVGGSTRGIDAQAAHFKTAVSGAWQSATGVYPGMSLKELEQLNGRAVQFYGWDTEEPGVALQKQGGALNFKKFGIQLHCLDCNEDRYYSKNGILSSDVLLRQNRRAYVSTLVMQPAAPAKQ